MVVYFLFHSLSKTSLERNPEPLFLFIYDRFIRVSLKQCNKQEEDHKQQRLKKKRKQDKHATKLVSWKKNQNSIYGELFSSKIILPKQRHH